MQIILDIEPKASESLTNLQIGLVRIATREFAFGRRR